MLKKEEVWLYDADQTLPHLNKPHPHTLRDTMVSYIGLTLIICKQTNYNTVKAAVNRSCVPLPTVL